MSWDCVEPDERTDWTITQVWERAVMCWRVSLRVYSPSLCFSRFGTRRRATASTLSNLCPRRRRSPSTTWFLFPRTQSTLWFAATQAKWWCWACTVRWEICDLQEIQNNQSNLKAAVISRETLFTRFSLIFNETGIRLQLSLTFIL